jgi:phosphate transport system permease protein
MQASEPQILYVQRSDATSEVELGALAAVYLAVNVVLGNFVDPILVGQQLRLSPIIVLVSLVFWGWTWGPIGAFLAVPLGVAAGLYLEEYAPKNWVTDIIEINVTNLAGVPSIIYGLLALGLFVYGLGLGETILVAGMVLALLTLPVVIVATREAIRSIPQEVREGAYALGADQWQTVRMYILPAATPGILTGTIIGLAQALGETAPLLLIGMNAFLTSPPGGIMEPATALPTQIFIWADSPERGFVARTSAAILLLLGFLITMNAIAIYLRARLERKW